MPSKDSSGRTLRETLERTKAYKHKNSALTSIKMVVFFRRQEQLYHYMYYSLPWQNKSKNNTAQWKIRKRKRKGTYSFRTLPPTQRTPNHWQGLQSFGFQFARA